MSLRTCTATILACIACCCLMETACARDATAARPPEIGEWIRQLGAEDFEVRENASRQLAELGLKAKPELLAGMRGDDAEIRWRCARLWAAVREKDFRLRAELFLNDAKGLDNYEFPGWDRYRKLFGVSQATRQTFLSLQEGEPELWEEFGDTSADDPWRFQERYRQLKSEMEDRRDRKVIAGTTAMSVLFMTETYQPTISAEDRRWMGELWNLSAVVDAVRSDEAWGSFKSKWLARRDDPRPAFERLMAGLSAGGDEVVVIARELLKNRETPSKQKLYCLLALAKSRDRQDDVLIRGYLNDATEIDTYLTRGIVIKSQLRDIALVTLIARAGKDPVDFGFRYMRRDDRMLFAPSTLGFKDDEERRAVVEKWLSHDTQDDDNENAESSCCCLPVIELP